MTVSMRTPWLPARATRPKSSTYTRTTLVPGASGPTTPPSGSPDVTDKKLYAYTLRDDSSTTGTDEQGARDTSKDITLHTDNTEATGIWSDRHDHLGRRQRRSHHDPQPEHLRLYAEHRRTGHGQGVRAWVGSAWYLVRRDHHVGAQRRRRESRSRLFLCARPEHGRQRGSRPRPTAP